MPKLMTKDQEIDEALDDLRSSLKANYKAKEALVKCQFEIKKTHANVMKANERLRALTLDTYE